MNHLTPARTFNADNGQRQRGGRMRKRNGWWHTCNESQRHVILLLWEIDRCKTCGLWRDEIVKAPLEKTGGGDPPSGWGWGFSGS